MGSEEDTEKVITQKKPDGTSDSEVSSLSSDTGGINARKSISAPVAQGKWRHWFSRTNTMVIVVALLLLLFLLGAFIGAAVAAAVVVVEATEN